MYVTAITFNYDDKTFSITARDLEKNTHWKRLAGNKIYDTTSASKDVYDIVYEGIKTASTKTKTRLEDAFVLAGYKKIPIRS